jgi:hypothetical protein
MSKLAIRALTTAILLAALLAIARPAAACNADEVPCAGVLCMKPDEVCCVDDASNKAWVCYPNTLCSSVDECLLGVGQTKDDEILDADGAPYGPTVERSCVAGRGEASGGTAVIGVAGLLLLLARRRAR